MNNRFEVGLHITPKEKLKMIRSALKTFLIIASILVLEILFYSAFIKPVITEWGATQDEQVMAMAGDSDEVVVASTRAIDIDAPQEVV